MDDDGRRRTTTEDDGRRRTRLKPFWLKPCWLQIPARACAAAFAMRRSSSFSLFSHQQPVSRPCPHGEGDEDGRRHELWALTRADVERRGGGPARPRLSGGVFLRAHALRPLQEHAFRAASLAVRDHLLESFNDTYVWYAEKGVPLGPKP